MTEEMTRERWGSMSEHERCAWLEENAARIFVRAYKDGARWRSMSLAEMTQAARSHEVMRLSGRDHAPVVVANQWTEEGRSSADPLYRHVKNLSDDEREVAQLFLESLAERHRKRGDDADCPRCSGTDRARCPDCDGSGGVEGWDGPECCARCDGEGHAVSAADLLRRLGWSRPCGRCPVSDPLPKGRTTMASEIERLRAEVERLRAACDKTTDMLAGAATSKASGQIVVVAELEEWRAMLSALDALHPGDLPEVDDGE